MPLPEHPASSDDWNHHWGSYAGTAQVNPAQKYRRELILQALDLGRGQAPARLLEIGCGQGDFSRDLKASHPDCQILGLDLSDKGVEIARKKVPDGVFFQQDLLEPLKIPAEYRGWATHAVCSEVLEHMDDPLTALKNARQCLAPGGKLVITVPGGPMSAFDKHIGHRGHFTPQRLEALLLDAGFRLATVHGAGFPFFNLYRLTVVARGKKLIADVADDRGLSASARAAMRLFGWLFRYNARETQRGWQLVATAVEPG